MWGFIMKNIQLTQEGYNNLQKELKELVDVKKPYAIERLHKARSMGDLSENSEYSAAKEELAFVEGRIQEIEIILKQAKIATNHNGSHIIDVGSTVFVEVDGKKEIYQIVGEFEADPMNKKLSHTSPIGKALSGKKIGESVQVTIPAGTKTYKIIDIK